MWLIQSRLPWMEKIIVVVSVDEFETMRKIIKDHKHTDKVVLVPGEASRHGSIYNGIKYMSSGHGECYYESLHNSIKSSVPPSELPKPETAYWTFFYSTWVLCHPIQRTSTMPEAYWSGRSLELCGELIVPVDLSILSRVLQLLSYPPSQSHQMKQGSNLSISFVVETPPDVVIVHDAVRMFLTDQDLNTVAMEAFKCGVSYLLQNDKPGYSELIIRSSSHMKKGCCFI